jgi:anti-sigma B factor antagonist
MNFEIEQHENDGIVVLHLKGPFRLGTDDAGFRERMQSLRASGKRNVILNLNGITEVDPAVADELVLLAEDFQKSGGRVVLVQPSLPDDEAPENLELQISMETYSEEQDAVNSFFPDRALTHYDILNFTRRKV